MSIGDLLVQLKVSGFVAEALFIVEGGQGRVTSPGCPGGKAEGHHSLAAHLPVLQLLRSWRGVVVLVE